MKVNQVITKIVVRAFFILLLVAAVPFFNGDQSKYKNIYLTFKHKWEMIFPIIIIVSFIILFITCAVKKYKELELNWLLVVNTIVLTAYGIAVFIKVSRLS